MVTKSNVHAARTSPIPGLVVIVLAVAAVLFGVAFVRKPSRAEDSLAGEVARLRASLEDEVKGRKRLERRLSDRVQELDEVSATLSELTYANDANAAALARLGGGPGTSSAASEAAPRASAEADDEARAAASNQAAETRAEIEALQRRAMDVEAELRDLRANLAARVAEAAGEGAPVAVTPVPAEVVVSVESAPGGLLSTEALSAARDAADTHAELLAPFFGDGHLQPGGARTDEAGPVSFAALFASGALAAPTEEALEENTGLRALAEFASNAPNDRTLWPYSRGSRTRVWYLRRDGRESVPLAQSLLREHGQAFVALGLLAP